MKVEKLVSISLERYACLGKDGLFREEGEWIKGLENVQLTLFNSPLLLMLQQSPQPYQDSTYVYLVEGEKDCETLKQHGLIATCNPMGAGKWRNSYNELLRGLTCFIITDNDKAGHEHSKLVLKSLQGIANSVQLIDLVELMPDLPPKGDITDFFERGGKL
ncbi:MAG: hypothetical protein IPM69_15400 [Ignavibacteria bacterium]|nr:hypothetical protein [Ignavibacteria bacterium]